MATGGKRSKGRFLYLFDWNAKSRKKLFSNKSESIEGSSQGKESADNLAIPRYLLQDLSENGNHSSFRGNGNYSCASSINGDDEYGTKAPGVVARLMGLDSMPTTSSCEASSFASYEPRAVGSFYYPIGATPFELEQHNMGYGYSPSKVEGFSWNPADPRMTKVHGRPLERFQTEVLAPRSAKPISITHHKLLSPIKSPGFILTKDAAYIMEAAARIIDSAPQPTGGMKIPSLGSPSSSFRYQGLKDKMDAAQRSYRLSESSKTPKRPGPVPQVRGTTSDSSDRKSLFNNTMSSPASSSGKAKNKGKSVPLAVQDKANVQKKNGSIYNDSRIQPQKEHKKLKQKEPITQKVGSSRTPKKNSVGVLRQNTERQNSASHKDQSTVKCSDSDLQPRKFSHRDNHAGPSKIVSKVFVSAENGSRKVVTTSSVVNPRHALNGFGERKPPPNGVSERRPLQNGVGERRPLQNGVSGRRPPPNGVSERRPPPNGVRERRPPLNGASERRHTLNGVSERRTSLNGVSEERSSMNRMKNISRSKHSTKGYCLGEQVLEASDERSAQRDISLQDNTRKDMDVISFTFTSPIKKVGSQSASTNEAILSNHHRLHGDSCATGVSATSSSSPPLALSGSVGLLLEQKFRELTNKIGSTKYDLMMEGPGTSSASCLSKSLVSHKVAPHSSMSYDDWSDGDQESVTWDDDCSSSMISKSSQYWEDIDGVDEQSAGSNNKFEANAESHLVDLNNLNPEWSISGSWMSSTTSDITYGNGHPSPRSQEVTSCVSSESVHPREEDSDFISASSHWELEYVRCMLHYAGLKTKLDKDCKTIDPGLFELLENLLNTSGSRNVELCSKPERKILFDGVSESVNAKYQRAFLGSYKSWVKWGTLLQNEWLTEEVYKEILCWQNMENLMVDELVDCDMSTHYGRWVDFEVESLEEGMDIENNIIESLIDELLDDLTV